jgi:uncharacterized protein (DUF885 family)
MRRPSRLPVVLLVAWNLFVVLPAVRAAAPQDAPASESERLRRLFDLAWEDKLLQTPEFATYTGFPGHNDRWSDFSEAGIARRQAARREQLKALLAIDRGRLTAAEQVDFDLFRRRLEGQIEAFSFPDDQMVLTQYDGVQLSVPMLLNIAPAATLRDYEDLLARLNSLPVLLGQDIAMMEKGLAAGVTPPKGTLLGAPDQVRALLTEDPWRSPLLARFRQISSNVPPDDQARIRRAALDAYGKAAPAFGKLLRFLTETYIPHARESIGLGDLPKWEMEALALHECIPGHHLQVTIAQGISGVPKVFNYHDYTAFVEGWGVYAETLGDEIGFYRDPYSKFGQLSYEMWRTMRLVVDTGIHSQGWTKQRAIDYFRDNTAQDERAIEVEVNRSIFDPGLGLAYKIGELKFKELRAAAQKELGPAFDLRAFHDEVLRHGAVPLDLLEQNVKTWTAGVKTASTRKESR